MTELILHGCAPEPLMSYLKALAILRIVSEQKDPSAKGCWGDGVFVLRSALDEQQLLDFFVNEYRPTPIVAPWNGGSGFNPGDAVAGMDAILGSTDPRFQPYRRVIKEIRSWPEMPRTFSTVDDLLATVQESIRTSRPGKQRLALEEILTAEEQARRNAEIVLGPLALPRSSLAAVETAAQSGTGQAKTAASAWWKTIRKMRTTCLSKERGGSKEAVLAACRSRLPEDSLAWIDAAYVLRADGSPGYNPLLGTGANEGRLDFSNNFMQRLAELLIVGKASETRRLLESSVFATPVSGLTCASIGQFDPGRAGGYNQGTEVETKSFKINPWDFVMMLEGATVISGTVGKRSLSHGYGVASIPFTVSFSGVGFSSSEYAEMGRAESWLPVWPNATSFAELRQLFGEGRGSVGRREAANGIDFSRAVNAFGVDRGLDGFVRYAYLPRRGTNYVALPAGMMKVGFKPDVRHLDELDPLLRQVDFFLGRFPTIPSPFATVRRSIDEAMFACCQTPNSQTFSTLMRALGRLEFLVAQRDRSKKPAIDRPLGGLSSEWLRLCDDGGVEVRIAAAIASIRSTGKVGPIRSNLAGVDPVRPWIWANGHGQHRWFGSNLVERLGGVLAQRMMDADRLNAPAVPVESRLRIYPHDLVSFLYGDTDDQRLEELLWGFSLIDWRGDRRNPTQLRWSAPLMTPPLPRGWSLLKLLFGASRIRGEEVKPESRIVALLQAGKATQAYQVAHARMRVSGLRPLNAAYQDELAPGRMLAGLLVPVGEQWQLESIVLQKKESLSR
jgi:CRISPR-associated protein Csx17